MNALYILLLSADSFQSGNEEKNNSAADLSNKQPPLQIAAAARSAKASVAKYNSEAFPALRKVSKILS